MAAAAMSVGTWHKMTTSTNQASVLGRGGVTASILPYANQCAWNPFSLSIEIIGLDHSGGAYMSWCRYRAADDNFVVMQPGGAINSGMPGGHEFAGTVVNPYDGRIYYRPYIGGIGGLVFYTADYNEYVFTSGEVATSPSGFLGVNTGTVWWTGSLSGAGAQGSLVVFNSAGANTSGSGASTDGVIQAWNPLTDTWFKNVDSASPFFATEADPGNTYHEVAAYSAGKNCMVYGGGNAAERKIWRMDADGSVAHVLTSVPSEARLGIQRGNLVCDPASGKFLLLSGSVGGLEAQPRLWELDPTGSGTWTEQTGGRAPPADIGVVDTASSSNSQNVVSCALPDLGVVAYITQLSSPSKSTFYLYKHA